MNEEEKKVVNIFIEKCNKYDESVEIKGISVGEEYRMLNTVCKALNLIEKLQKENEELKNKLSLKQFDINVVYNAYLEKLNEYEENSISIQKVKDKIEEIQKEYNKLDKQVDEYINDVNKDLSKYYENKERIGEMQMLSYFIDNLQELMEESEKN